MFHLKFWHIQQISNPFKGSFKSTELNKIVSKETGIELNKQTTITGYDSF